MSSILYLLFSLNALRAKFQAPAGAEYMQKVLRERWGSPKQDEGDTPEGFGQPTGENEVGSETPLAPDIANRFLVDTPYSRDRTAADSLNERY